MNCTCRLLHISFLLMVSVGIANASGQTVERAFCQDGKAHVVYENHSAKTVFPAVQQVGCTDMAVADDHRTFGWSVQVENCCTSYPISIAVIVMKDGKRTVLQSDQTVWQWHFVDHGNRVAVLSGPVHGNATKAVLYVVQTGKAIATWLGTGDAPEWANGWEDLFGSDPS